MECHDARELISARIDGELAAVDEPRLERHLATCPGCTAHAAAVADVHRAVRVRPAEPVPDLVSAILDSAAPLHRRAASVTVLRYLAGVLGVTQLLLAVPELLGRQSGVEVHLSRHLGAWVVAFSAGLIVAGIQPWRVRGMLPMVSVLAVVMVVATVVDVQDGSAVAAAESIHLLELAGLVTLWLLGRWYPRSAGPGDADHRPVPSASPLERLRLVVAPASATEPPGVAPLAPVYASAAGRRTESPSTRSSRALATRDRTVPTGHPHTSAASA